MLGGLWIGNYLVGGGDVRLKNRRGVRVVGKDGVIGVVTNFRKESGARILYLESRGRGIGE